MSKLFAKSQNWWGESMRELNQIEQIIDDNRTKYIVFWIYYKSWQKRRKIDFLRSRNFMLIVNYKTQTGLQWSIQVENIPTSLYTVVFKTDLDLKWSLVLVIYMMMFFKCTANYCPLLKKYEIAFLKVCIIRWAAYYCFYDRGCKWNVNMGHILKQHSTVMSSQSHFSRVGHK